MLGIFIQTVFFEVRHSIRYAGNPEADYRRNSDPSEIFSVKWNANIQPQFKVFIDCGVVGANECEDKNHTVLRESPKLCSFYH